MGMNDVQWQLRGHACKGHGESGAWATLAVLIAVGKPMSASDVCWLVPYGLGTVRRHLKVLCKEGAIAPAGQDPNGDVVYVPQDD